MDRTELVHVVALVGAGTGIHEGKHSRYQKRGLVVRDSIGTRENGAGFTVFPVAVAEEQGIRCRISVSDMAGLAYEASGNGGTVLH